MKKKLSQKDYWTYAMFIILVGALLGFIGTQIFQGYIAGRAYYTGEIDLADYPVPFIKENQFKGLIAIGDKASTEEVLAAADIAASLQNTIDCKTDNCPDVYNPDQLDSDGNGIGDACEETPSYLGNVELISQELYSLDLVNVEFKVDMYRYPTVETTGPPESYRGFYEIYTEMYSESNKENIYRTIVGRFYKNESYPKTKTITFGYYDDILYGPPIDPGKHYKIDFYFQEYPWGDYDYSKFFIKSIEFDSLKIENITCIDSDSGLNYYVKGTASKCGFYNNEKICKEQTDRCEGPGLLDEVYCVNDYINKEHYICPAGCQDGACTTKIQDDFNDNLTGDWKIIGGTWLNENREYHQTNTGGGDLMSYKNNGIDGYKTFEIEAKARIISGKYALIGFTTDASSQNWIHGYISNFDQKIGIGKMVKGVYTNLANKPYTINLNQVYDIKFVANQPNFELWINGVRELSIPDLDYGSKYYNYLGYAFLGSSWAHVSFDDFAMSGIPLESTGGSITGAVIVSSYVSDHYADEVTDFEPGTDANGFLSESLGAPDNIAYYMGVNGVITLKFTNNILVDDLGEDLIIYTHEGEDSNIVSVELSNDGINFIGIGTTTRGSAKNYFDLSGSGIDLARYVRLTDVDALLPSGKDGYNLDAVEAVNSIDPYADEILSFEPGSDSGGTPSESLGQPDNSVLYLGVGGIITLEFTDNVVIDGPGDDLAVYTHAGEDSNMVQVEVSKDNIDYAVLGVTPLGIYQNSFDLEGTGLTSARYVRLRDVGALLPSGKDGYNLDAVEAINTRKIVPVENPDPDNDGIPNICTGQIPAGSTKLASEIADLYAQNLIVLGNPCDNTIAAKLKGNPYDCRLGLTENQGHIKLYQHDNGNVALLIESYSGFDIRKTAKVIANYLDYDLAGQELCVDLDTYSVGQCEPVCGNGICELGEEEEKCTIYSAGKGDVSGSDVIYCDYGYKLVGCEDIGEGQNHGCDKVENGCLAWEGKGNYGTAGCRITCEATDCSAQCQQDCPPTRIYTSVNQRSVEQFKPVEIRADAHGTQEALSSITDPTAVIRKPNGRIEAIPFEVSSGSCTACECPKPINIIYAQEATEETHTFSVDLDKGWSLVSFPVILDNYSIESAFSSLNGKYTKISYYEGYQHEEVDLETGTIRLLDDDTHHLYMYPVEAVEEAIQNSPHRADRIHYIGQVDNKHSYFVELAEPGTFTVTGKLPTYVEIKLQKGFNSISFVDSAKSDIMDIAPFSKGRDMQSFVISSYVGNIRSSFRSDMLDAMQDQSLLTFEPALGYIVRFEEEPVVQCICPPNPNCYTSYSATYENTGIIGDYSINFKANNLIRPEIYGSSFYVYEEGITGKYLIEHDIGGYIYIRSNMEYEYASNFGKIRLYTAEYDKETDDKTYTAGVIEFENENDKQRFIEELVINEGAYKITINGQKVYLLGNQDVVVWPSGNLVVYVHVPRYFAKQTPIEEEAGTAAGETLEETTAAETAEVIAGEMSGEEETALEKITGNYIAEEVPAENYELPTELVEAYLEKYPSDATYNIFTITLNPEWNLISIPLVLENSDINYVFDEIKGSIKVVYSYDPTTVGEWRIWSPNAPSDLTAIEPGKAYWVYTNNREKLTVRGTIGIGDPPAIPTFNLRKGWNLIGIHSLEDLPASEAFANIEGDYTSLWTYENGELKRLRWNPILTPGQGYWIYMNREGIIVP